MDWIPVGKAVSALRAAHGPSFSAQAALRKRLGAGLMRARATAIMSNGNPDTNLNVPTAFWGTRAQQQSEDWVLGDFTAALPRDDRGLSFKRVELFGLMVLRDDMAAMGAVFEGAGDAADEKQQGTSRSSAPGNSERMRASKDDLTAWAEEMVARKIPVRDLRAPLIRASWPGPMNTVPDYESAKEALNEAWGKRGPGRPSG